VSVRSGAEDEEVAPATAPPLAAYVALLVVYVALGYLLKSVVLNWIVGPLFLLAVLYLMPRLLGRRGSGDGG